MQKVVLLLVVCLSLFVRSAPKKSEMVWLKDVTTSLQPDKRKFSDPNLPDILTFELRGRSRALTFNLKRNHAINPNADVYFMHKSNDGPSHLEKALNLEKEELAYYQDRQNGAFMTVKCLRRSNGWCDRVINGNVLIEERNYDLQPADNDVTSRELFANPDLGTRYVLRDQANIQSELAVTHKDKTTANGEQELKDLFRRFPNGQKQFPVPKTVLVSRNRPSLHNRGNHKQVYYVETAVVLDQGIWNFYSSLMMQTNNTQEKDGVVERKIREVYSHIMNGVNLRYKEIEDPDIEIIVSPHKFYIFKNMTDFSLSYTKVKYVGGKFHIKTRSHLYDLTLWTRAFSKSSDHVMLFSRFERRRGLTQAKKIYAHLVMDYRSFGYVGQQRWRGVSYDGKVCDPSYKTSLIRSRDYFPTVNTAAHELGHNLGADHDGSGNAVACRADDRFIMTPQFLDDSIINQPYSRNPWIFSNCSVKAFKDTLKDKMCLINVAVIYDNEEWNGIIQKMPGQMYSLNQQCEFINGLGSVFCGTVTPDICQFMQCTDTKWNICLPDHFSAHRGTTCGDNKWCIEGLCVSKP